MGMQMVPGICRTSWACIHHVRPSGGRDAIVQTAADNMSAGSRVTPGGYAVLADRDVAQFTLNDSRDPAEIYQAIRRNHQEVVFKNWDNRI